jgi:hypothetical protein
MTIDSAGRQEKALARYQQAKGEWTRISDNLAKKFGKDKSALIMERSHHEYRARKEEIEILEAAIPISEKLGSMSWQMTLRNSTYNSLQLIVDNADGINYVKVGGNWPYPLFCPVMLAKKP